MAACDGAPIWSIQRAVNNLSRQSAQLRELSVCVCVRTRPDSRIETRKSKDLVLAHCCFIVAWDIAALTRGDDHFSSESM